MSPATAECEDCPETEEGSLEEVAEWAEAHERKERHDVSIERVATDGGIEPGWYVVDESEGVVLDGPHSMHSQAMVALADQEGDHLVVASDGHLEMLVEQGDELDFGPARGAGEPELVTDGGSPLPYPAEWDYEAVVFGVDRVHGNCLAITGSGKPCTNNAYDGAFCGMHHDVDDPEVMEGAHQWARISDGDRVVAVCVNCEAVWAGGPPALHVECPTCGAGTGERCGTEKSVRATHAGKKAPIAPHPERRGLARENGIYEACPEFPDPEAEDGQDELVTDGGECHAWIVTCPHDARTVVDDDLEAEVLEQLEIYDVSIASWDAAVATDGAGGNRHYAEPGEVVTLENTVDDREVEATAGRDGLVVDDDHPHGFSVEYWDRVDDRMPVLPDGGQIQTLRGECPDCGGPAQIFPEPDNDERGHIYCDAPDECGTVHRHINIVDFVDDADRPRSWDVDGYLRFAEEYVEPIHAGKKTATVRYDDADGIVAGDVVDLLTEDGTLIDTVRVKKTAECETIEALDVLEAVGARYPCESPCDLVAGVDKHYDDPIKPTTIVRPIVWDPTEVVDGV